MSQFVSCYRPYLKRALKTDNQFGFDVRTVAKIEPLLAFLYKNWWHVEIAHLSRLPVKGPALLVGNSAGLVPWPALMLMYALMTSEESPRRLSIVADMDWIKDQNLRLLLEQLGFVPWSSANLKRLFANGEIVATFPEGLRAAGKPFADRYRMLEFDWTRLLPAVEENVPVFPVATLGCEESIPTLANIESLAKLLSMPAFPLTPFFPWFPFPFNMGSLPVHWRMAVLNKNTGPKETDRDRLQEIAKKQSAFVEGEIQAELNRMLRSRVRSF